MKECNFRNRSGAGAKLSLEGRSFADLAEAVSEISKCSQRKAFILFTAGTRHSTVSGNEADTSDSPPVCLAI